MRQIKRNLPFVHRFTSSDVTAVVLRGPDHEIAKTAPTLVQDGATARYQCVITPDEYGTWTLTTADAGGAITHETHFECVQATDLERSLGIGNRHHALVPFWPASVVTATSATISHSGADNRVYMNDVKWRIPWDGYVYGVQIWAKDNIANADSLKFFTANGPHSGFTVRGISNNWKATTPVEGEWTSTSEWKTVLFTKPVLARQGDLFGVEIDGGTTFDGLRRVQLDATSRTYSNMVRMTTLLNLSGANVASAVYNAGYVWAAKPMMEPPAIAIGGHSFWAGHSSTQSTYTLYEDGVEDYTPSYDLSGMLSEMLGVSVVNVAKGGTSIASWVSSTGLLVNNVGQIRPSVLIYDTTYNDTAANYSDAAYAAMLDRLLAHCDTYNVELILIEGPGSTYAYDQGFVRTIERYNQVTEEWASKVGVPYIPINWRLCRTATGDSAKYRRVFYPGGDSGLLNYGQSSGSPVHPSYAGRRAVATAIASALRFRRHDTTGIYMRKQTNRQVIFI